MPRWNRSRVRGCPTPPRRNPFPQAKRKRPFVAILYGRRQGQLDRKASRHVQVHSPQKRDSRDRKWRPEWFGKARGVVPGNQRNRERNRVRSEVPRSLGKTQSQPRFAGLHHLPRWACAAFSLGSGPNFEPGSQHHLALGHTVLHELQGECLAPSTSAKSSTSA